GRAPALPRHHQRRQPDRDGDGAPAPVGGGRGSAPAPGDGAGPGPPDRASDGGLHLEPRGGHGGGHPTCLLPSLSLALLLSLALSLLSLALFSLPPARFSLSRWIAHPGRFGSVPRSEPRGWASYASRPRRGARPAP